MAKVRKKPKAATPRTATPRAATPRTLRLEAGHGDGLEPFQLLRDGRYPVYVSEGGVFAVRRHDRHRSWARACTLGEIDRVIAQESGPVVRLLRLRCWGGHRVERIDAVEMTRGGTVVARGGGRHANRSASFWYGWDAKAAAKIESLGWELKRFEATVARRVERVLAGLPKVSPAAFRERIKELTKPGKRKKAKAKAKPKPKGRAKS